MTISRRAFIAAGAASFLAPVQPLRAASRSWFVDNEAPLGGDGTSWRAAWRNPVDIDWRRIGAGDVVYVSGGAVRKTYRGLFEVNRSGAPGNPITITPGVDPEHSGRVVFDFGSSADDYVHIHDCTHVTFQGFDLRNGSSGAVAWLEGLGGGVVFQNNVVETGNGSGASNARGIDIRRCRGGAGANIVAANRVSTPDSAASQTDGMYTMRNGHGALRILNNVIEVNNRRDTGHSDCFQSYEDGSMVISGNVFRGPSAGGNNHTVWIADVQSGGTITLSGNRCIAQNRSSNVTVWRSGPDAERGSARIEGNEITGGSRALNFERTDRIEIVGNDVRPDHNGFAYFMALDAPPPGNVEQNRVRGQRVASFLGSTKAWSEWQALGFDRGGSWGEPEIG